MLVHSRLFVPSRYSGFWMGNFSYGVDLREDVPSSHFIPERRSSNICLFVCNLSLEGMEAKRIACVKFMGEARESSVFCWGYICRR